MPSYPLERFWPCSTVPGLQWEKKQDLTASIHIGDFRPSLNGFPVLHRPHFESDAAPCELLVIPCRYRNGLRLLNAKISFLQQCVRLLSDTKRKTSKDQLENMRLARDSAMRNLVFSTKVRKTFLDDILEASGQKGWGQGMPAEQLQDDYECLTMNTWLRCEFRCGRHDPHFVKQTISDADWESNILEGKPYFC